LGSSGRAQAACGGASGRRKRMFVGAERARDGGRCVVRCERRRMREAAAAGRLGVGLEGLSRGTKTQKHAVMFERWFGATPRGS